MENKHWDWITKRKIPFQKVSQGIFPKKCLYSKKYLKVSKLKHFKTNVNYDIEIYLLSMSLSHISMQSHISMTQAGENVRPWHSSCDNLLYPALNCDISCYMRAIHSEMNSWKSLIQARIFKNKCLLKVLLRKEKYTKGLQKRELGTV